MEKNEIKKALYKQNPKATLDYIRKGNAYYFTVLEDGTRINFEVPVSDMGDADFLAHMDSKLLNRWIV
jgi:hypothetical protein